jgi:hypothetical protein
VGLALVIAGVAGTALAGSFVPEIDGPSASAALALVAGGVVVLRVRK